MGKEKIRIIIAICVTLLMIFALSLVDQHACNPKGSLAEKINWAGHGSCE